jgi:hypothetical protein
VSNGLAEIVAATRSLDAEGDRHGGRELGISDQFAVQAELGASTGTLQRGAQLRSSKTGSRGIISQLTTASPALLRCLVPAHWRAIATLKRSSGVIR